MSHPNASTADKWKRRYNIITKSLFLGVLSNIDQKDAILLVKSLQELPPKLNSLVKLEICDKWFKVFAPISNYCAYSEVIKQKQSSFMTNAIDNVIRGNEVIAISI